MALAKDSSIYSRGVSLVSVARQVVDNPNQTTPTIISLAEAIAGCHLTKNAGFYVMRELKDREPEPKDVHPPDWLIRSVTRFKEWHGTGIRPLIALAECPYPREDGSLVEEPGYDDATGTLYMPSIAFPRVKANPSQADAREAWERLKDLIGQFPFKGEEDRVVWLQALLAAIARPAIDRSVPGTAFIGNKAGTGKGLLIDLIGIMAQGRDVPTTVYPSDKDEAGKVTLAIALEGRKLVHFDNLEEGSSYGSSNLDSKLTSTAVSDRPLGTSTMPLIPLRTNFFVSGNNIGPCGDADRRWLPCNLVSKLERPEERGDLKIKDLRKHTLEHRGEFVRDALTILKAHAVAGRPEGNWDGNLGSYEAWDKIIRGAVWYATGLDCGHTRRELAAKSGEKMKSIALLKGWMELPGGQHSGVTAGRAISLVTDNPGKYATLRNALKLYGKEDKFPSSTSLGKKLSVLRDNPIAGMRLEDVGDEHSAILWKVVTTDSESIA